MAVESSNLASAAGRKREPVCWDLLAYRNEAYERDLESVRTVVESTGFFSPVETSVAVELVGERLSKGAHSGYEFIFAELMPADGLEGPPKMLGYSCYGEIPCTAGSYSLYWIVVHQQWRGLGLGPKLMERTEKLIAQAHGRALYAETSGRAQYAPTRRFYLKTGFTLEAVFKDFYSLGDDKLVFKKLIRSS